MRFHLAAYIFPLLLLSQTSYGLELNSIILRTGAQGGKTKTNDFVQCTFDQIKDNVLVPLSLDLGPWSSSRPTNVPGEAAIRFAATSSSEIRFFEIVFFSLSPMGWTDVNEDFGSYLGSKFLPDVETDKMSAFAEVRGSTPGNNLIDPIRIDLAPCADQKAN